jgi:lauroyl/myristoyl acyltransferase
VNNRDRRTLEQARRLRRQFARSHRIARRVFPFSPWLAFRITDFWAWWHFRSRNSRRRNRLFRMVASEALLDRAFGPMSAEALKQLSWRSIRCFLRSSLIDRVVNDRGPQSVARLIDVEGLEHAEGLVAGQRGVIAVTWHAGVKTAASAVLAGLPVAVLKVQNSKWRRTPEGWSILRRMHKPTERLSALKQCQNHLKRGGWVAMAFDTPSSYSGRPVEARFRGRLMRFTPGPVVLSLRTQSPILPISTRWAESGDRITVQFYPPVHPGAFSEAGDVNPERTMIEAVARCGEDYWFRYPWELTGSAIRLVLDAPPIDGAVDAGALEPAAGGPVRKPMDRA